MNDQQLIEALRRLDRPVEPDRAFADRLFDDLVGPRRGRPIGRRELLLVAALLALAALGAALAVGSRLFENRTPLTLASPPAVDASPATPPPYAVDVPEGLTLVSSVSEVEAAALRISGPQFGLDGGVRSIVSIAVLSPGEEVSTQDGGAISSDVPLWAVSVVNQDDRLVVLFIADGTLVLTATDLPPTDPGPHQTPFALPTWDPATPLELVAEGGGGRAPIAPQVLPIPMPGLPAQVGTPIVAGSVIWAMVTPIYTDDPAYLARVDATTNELTTVALPADIRFGSHAAGLNRLWLSDEASLHALDPSTGGVLRTFTLDESGSLLGEDEHGVWLRVLDGIAVVDPETGEQRRRIDSVETGQFAYRGIWAMPSFGSLWDTDRETGLVHRIDPISGESVATIDVADLGACGDPVAIPDANGLPVVLATSCGDGLALIDPATNAIAGTVSDAGIGVSIDGSWWLPRVPASTGLGWNRPGSLVQVDPATGLEMAVLTLSRDRTALRSPVVAGGALWLVVGERAEQNQGHDHNQAFVRIPLAELVR
jgi:hypothetical protein